MLTFLTSTLAGFVTGEARQSARLAVRALVLYVLAFILTAIGFGFLLAAGFMEVAKHLGPKRAALAIGGGFIAVAIVVVIVHMVTRRVRVRSATKRRKDEMTSVVTAAAVSLLPVLLSGKGARGLLLAPVGLLAYAIYQENFRRKRRRPPEQDSGD